MDKPYNLEVAWASPESAERVVKVEVFGTLLLDEEQVVQLAYDLLDKRSLVGLLNERD